MTTAYILTGGEYSDYHIIGVYSTKELAEKAQFVYTNSRIQEYEMDIVLDCPPGMKGWYVMLDGNPEQTYCNSASPYYATIPFEREFIEPSGTKVYQVYCWAVDEEHAIKIAQDKFYQHRAQKAGIA